MAPKAKGKPVLKRRRSKHPPALHKVKLPLKQPCRNSSPAGKKVTKKTVKRCPASHSSATRSSSTTSQTAAAKATAAPRSSDLPTSSTTSVQSLVSRMAIVRMRDDFPSLPRPWTPEGRRVLENISLAGLDWKSGLRLAERNRDLYGLEWP